jgi:hypothetical protein
VDDDHDEPGGDPASTLTDLRPGSSAKARWASWITVGLLVLLLCAAGAGLLGVHTRQASASAGGYTLTVTYAGIARAGLDVPMRVQVDSDHPWGEHITLSISREYFTIFETQGFFPDADSSTGNGQDVVFSFNPPADGQPFVLDYDAYIQPSAQLGASARISVLDGETAVVSADIRTFLFP